MTAVGLDCIIYQVFIYSNNYPTCRYVTPRIYPQLPKSRQDPQYNRISLRAMHACYFSDRIYYSTTRSERRKKAKKTSNDCNGCRNVMLCYVLFCHIHANIHQLTKSARPNSVDILRYRSSFASSDRHLFFLPPSPSLLTVKTRPANVETS